MSAAQVSRIERAQLQSVGIEQLARVGVVVGLDVRVKAYPGPDPLRDAGQNAVLDRLGERLHPSLRFPREVPLPIHADLRAWDGYIRGLRRGQAGRSTLPVEAETRINDFQAQTRRIWLKARDAEEPYVLLVVSDTRRNRDSVRAAGQAIREAFPVSSRRALAALAVGMYPGGSAVVFL
jgi:hypothetical protein